MYVSRKIAAIIKTMGHCVCLILLSKDSFARTGVKSQDP